MVTVAAGAVSDVTSGFIRHAAWAGRPLQARFTNPSDPATGVTVTLKAAVSPAFTVALAAPATDIVKSAPVPVSVAVCA